MKVGDGIDAERGDFRFDEKVAGKFDEHVGASVPGYDDVQTLVSILSDFYSAEGGVIYDLGCATGTTLQRLQRHAETCRLVGLDASAPMCTRARQKVPEATILQSDLDERQEFPDACLVISLFTLQFVRLDRRRAVLESVRRGLLPGGALFLFEKAWPDSPRVAESIRQFHHELKGRNGFTPAEVWGKDRSLRGVMTPLTVGENARLLSEAGFTTVERIWTHGPFAGWLAEAPL